VGARGRIPMRRHADQSTRQKIFTSVFLGRKTHGHHPVTYTRIKIRSALAEFWNDEFSSVAIGAYVGIDGRSGCNQFEKPPIVLHENGTAEGQTRPDDTETLER